MTNKSTPANSRTTSPRKGSTASRSARSTKQSHTASEISTDEEVLHAGPEADTVSGADANARADANSDASPEPVAVEEITIVPQAELRKKELIDLAVERSGIKKRDAKPAIEAALAVLGIALSEGREMNIVPLGKIKVTRMKKAGNGQIINARVRQPDEAENSLDDPLAQAAE